MNDFRILHITHSLNVGGLERVVVDLASSFRNKGHAVGICCLDSKDPLGKKAEQAGVRVYALDKKPGLAWNLPLKITAIIKAEGYNVIHTHNEAGLLYGVPAALCSKANNIVHTEHGKEPEYDTKRFLKIAERILLKKTKRIVTVSEDLRRKMAATGVDLSRVNVIPNGIDIDEFWKPDVRDGKRRALGFSENDIVIGHIARLVPLKNQKFLIALFKGLFNENPTLKLVIVGDGPLNNELRSYARDIGLAKSIIFLGQRSDIAELLSSFDLFVLPSLTEGISITLIEAMAAGIPVIASDVGGNPELIQNGKTGLLVPLDSREKWHKTIQGLLADSTKRKTMAERAKTHVHERFSLKAMIDSYCKIYGQKGN